jgi:murein DD-endopeptidase MepM/ murein hydrolase activator NlpD
MPRLELTIGRGAGVFEPFVDAYQKILEFNKKSSEVAVETLKLQAKNIGQEMRAGNRETRNAAKSLNLKTGANFAGFPITDVPGSPRAYRGGTHEGYDIGTPIGTSISYMVGGVVKSIDKVGRGNGGKMLEVQLENGIIGLSMHLSDVLVKVGDKFQAGQILARTGDTGAGPAHLHQESAAYGYKTGEAGASLAYLQLNGRSSNQTAAGGGGQVIGPSAVQIAAQNQEEIIARQRALAAALEKDAAQVYNALLELNSVDITSKVNQQLYDLSKALKTVKRDAEDTVDRLLPPGAAADFINESKGLKREIEDLSDKYRDLEKQIAESARGELYAKLLTSPEFINSAEVQKLTTALKGYGITQDQINNLFVQGKSSAGEFKRILEELGLSAKQSFDQSRAALEALLARLAEGKIQEETLNSQMTVRQAAGLPTDDLQVRRERLRITKELRAQEEALARTTDPTAKSLISIKINELKSLQKLNMEVIPGVATLGQTLAVAFTPAVDALYAFITGTKSAGDAFREFAYQVIKELAMMAAKAAVVKVLTMVLNGLGIGGGNWFSYADGGVAPGGFAAFANGGVAPGGIKFQAFAGGGTVTGPTLGLVGEGKYNEAIVPLPDGKSIPVELNNGGGGGDVNINVNVDATGSKVQGDPGEANKLASAVSSVVQAEIVKQKRPGGLLA